MPAILPVLSERCHSACQSLLPACITPPACVFCSYVWCIMKSLTLSFNHDLHSVFVVAVYFLSVCISLVNPNLSCDLCISVWLRCWVYILRLKLLLFGITWVRCLYCIEDWYTGACWKLLKTALIRVGDCWVKTSVDPFQSGPLPPNVSSPLFSSSSEDTAHWYLYT